MMVVTTKTTNIAVTKMTDSAAAITKTYKKPIYETIPRQKLIGYYEIIVWQREYIFIKDSQKSAI